MENFIHLITLLKQPSLIKNYKPIILLSHMRANTSLIGHILGSNSEINGYYEQHIGYYSWKSLIRQKLLYCKQHDLKEKSKYMFDKVLHNEHFVSPTLLNNRHAKVLISIRKPETTIPSIIKLYQKVDPSHVFSTLEGAADYYIARLQYLVTISKQLNNYFYYDAEQLRDNTTECLAGITDYLKLTTPLSPEFKTQKLTGVGNAGDHSGNLNSAKVKKVTTDYSEYDLTQIDIKSINSLYEDTLSQLKSNA
ncbi:hypothetical protein [Alishewanella tabrizica]|uniref:Sulfotransferase family protein n=1 Tax=Alishewanella tabrizica TaxID=671278 RepID=A0ABQ2WLK1_9ALTE|nr:hypothetical protein [Alishewanella tabrizica]GGW62706.1 hypothetical protein GCM10008111_18340 [Alishewanella tabrizica]